MTTTGMPMNPLQQLIRDRMAEQGWSYADVARRGDVPRSTVHHLATAEHLRRPPHPATLEGLAEGLGVPIDAIRAAAASAAGLTTWQEPVTDPEISVLVAALSRLSPDDRRHVLALIQSLLSADRSA
ncbi:helix-turn-helix transcriptional regulator [Actinoplanes sp. NPDC051346]|uniref:helix-turn-helix domain-containing protein n=1 Tax=Actinoplanes sp. NPDC051346 TaxID=3155048 RepID=UPI0034436552